MNAASACNEPLVVLGLVVTVAPGFSPHLLERAIPGVILGDPQGLRYPVVLEAPLGGDELLLERLRTVPGVIHVDVSYAELLEAREEERS